MKATTNDNLSDFIPGNINSSRHIDFGAKKDGQSHSNTPQFFNQPNYQNPASENHGNNIYLKVLIDENNQLKRELKEMTEVLGKHRKGVGNKKRMILNEIMSLISTKNTFEERYVSEISKCPYQNVKKVDSKPSSQIVNQLI